MNFVLVGLGGAIGSVLRYAISLIPYKNTFPLLTLVTNILGAVIIGVIAAAAAKSRLNDDLTLLLKTGLCGGFTTFSTFSLEAYTLMQNGHYAYMTLYILLSLVGCIIGVRLGMSLIA